ncbi:MAG: cell wall hydrolase [Ruminococcus sp.]|nr:cell wall hydrolase [Ruminococcus sp.]
MDLKKALAACFAVICIALPGSKVSSAAELDIDIGGYEQTAVTEYLASAAKTAEPEETLSDEEIELIARVTMAEAEGESEYAKRLVIDTVLNRADSERFPDTVTDVIFQPHQFSVMHNGRYDRCEATDELITLVKEELNERTDSDVVFFREDRYSDYGEPMFKECCTYFSSYD